MSTSTKDRFFDDFEVVDAEKELTVCFDKWKIKNKTLLKKNCLGNRKSLNILGRIFDLKCVLFQTVLKLFMLSG